MATRGQEKKDRTEVPIPAGRDVIDTLVDSFPLLPGESEWLLTLFADEIARIMTDD